MRRTRAAWIGILLLNVVWILILPSKSDKAAALFGAAVAGLAIILPRVSVRGRALPIPASLVLPFVLPGVALLATPRIAMWDLDGRSWLILAWLWTGIVLSLSRRGSDPDIPAESATVRPATLLFIMAAAGFWLSIVADLGIRRVVLETDRTVPQLCRSDVLTTAFSIWENNPAREHLFLGWRTEDSFRARAPYANHVHPYLLTMYAWVSGVRALSGGATYVATNTVPFLYMFVLLAGFTTLLARAGLLRARNTPIALVTIFVAYGLIITAWRFWNDLYRFGSDNPYPLLMGVLLLVYGFLLAPLRPVAAAVSAAVFVALSPIHLPMLLLALFALFGDRGVSARDIIRKNRALVTIAVAATVAGLASYLTPWLLIRGNDYQAVGSSYLLRSGLDGDTRYFSNFVQASVAPCIRGGCCWPRTAGELLWPAIVPLGVLVLAVFRKGARPDRSIGHLLIFLATPYFVSLVLFPQSVSVHPYLYDHMLLIPIVVAGSVLLLTAAIENRLRGIGLLVFLIAAGAMLMANLNAIAQSIATMPR